MQVTMKISVTKKLKVGRKKMSDESLEGQFVP